MIRYHMTSHDLAGVTYLLLPLLGGGVVHGIWMKYDWFPALKRPIDGGTTWRGIRLFGPNKTWRGPIAIGVGSAIVFGLQATLLHRIAVLRGAELFDYGAINGWLFGFAFGFIAMLGELPNSFLKRRCGVAPGAAGGGRHAWFFYLYDQVDILLGAWLVLAFVMPVRLVHVALSLVIVTVIHQALSSIGYRIGMRTTPR